MLSAVNVTPPSSRAARIALSLGAGLAMCAGLPPWGWWPLTIVGVAVWALLLHDQPARARFWIGAGVSLALYLPSTMWMVKMTPLGWPIGVSIWFPLVFGLVSASCPPSGVALALPGAVVLAEWVRWHAPFGGVPLSMFAYTQARGPLLPVARIGGTLAVSAAVAMAGVALAGLVRRHTYRNAAITAAALILVTLGGVVAPRGTATSQIRVAAVQGGGEQETEHFATDYDEVLQRHIDTALTLSGHADLVVLPENIVNVNGRWETSSERARLVELNRKLQTTLIVGVVEDRDSADHFWNFATALNPNGNDEGRYDKVRRVPFGEYVPLRGLIARFASGQLPGRDAVPGDLPAVLHTDLATIGVVISWETFFPRRVRDALHHGAEILTNPTNGSSYWLSQVQTQQVASSTLRAVESGRWLVQAAPTGMSAIIDPNGNVVARSGIGEATVLEATAELRTGTTLAMRWNEVPVLVLSAIAVALAWRRHATRKNPESSGEDRFQVPSGNGEDNPLPSNA